MLPSKAIEMNNWRADVCMIGWKKTAKRWKISSGSGGLCVGNIQQQTHLYLHFNNNIRIYFAHLNTIFYMCMHNRMLYFLGIRQARKKLVHAISITKEEAFFRVQIKRENDFSCKRWALNRDTWLSLGVKAASVHGPPLWKSTLCMPRLYEFFNIALLIR